MRRIINPQIADELELHRPTKGVAEWLFRASLLILALLAITYGTLRVFISEKTLETTSGMAGKIVGMTFGLCFFYVINYMAYRHCPNRLIRWTWFVIEALIIFGIVMATLNDRN